jgi:hypothetical protein
MRLRPALAAALLVALLPPVAHADPVDVCIAAAEDGQRLRLGAKLTGAREKLLACSQAECPAVLRGDCARWLAEIDLVLPSIVVRAVDGAGADVVDARVFVDDRMIAPRLDGTELHVDPGEHVLRFVGARGDAVEQRILVREGERHRVVTVVFPPPPIVPSVSRPDAVDVVDAPPAPPPHRSLVAPIAAFAGGAISLGIASYFWISGLADHDSLASSCAGTHSCSQASVTSAHDKLVIGDVAGGIGIGLAALGAGIFLFGGGKRPAVGVAISGVAGGGLIQFGGTL